MRAFERPKYRATAAHFFGVHAYRKRKLGTDQTAWIAFAATMRETIGRECGVEELTDDECVAVIDALKQLSDRTARGQLALSLEDL